MEEKLQQNKYYGQKIELNQKKRWTVRITGRDLSRKGNHLRKLVREINIIRDRLHYVFQFHQNRWTTRFQQPLWRTSKSPKTNIFAEELIERTLFRLDEIASKMRTKKKTAINRRKNSKPLNKVKPIKKPERRFQTQVKLSFRELCHLTLSGLGTFVNIAISLS